MTCRRGAAWHAAQAPRRIASPHRSQPARTRQNNRLRPRPGAGARRVASRSPASRPGRASVDGVRLTVLGCCGAWPTVGAAGSGFLVERGGFRLLVDVGYAVVPRLQEYVAVDEV